MEALDPDNVNLPTTDEEAKEFIGRYLASDEAQKASLLGIYLCRRGMGDSVHDAFFNMANTYAHALLKGGVK